MTALQRIEVILIACVAAMRVVDLLRIVFGHFLLREQQYDLSPELLDELSRSPLLPSIAVIGGAAGLRYPKIESDVARADLVCIVDGDATLDRDALLFAVRPLLEDPATIAVSGMSRVAPGGWLARFEAMEDLRQLLTGRHASGFVLLDGAGAVPPARDRSSAGETPAATLALVRRRHPTRRVAFVAEPLCTIAGAARLRDVRARMKRRRPPLRDVVGAVIELLGYELTLFGLALALIPAGMAIEFAVVSIGFGIINSMMAAALEAPELLGLAIVEWLGFRELATIWRARGVIDSLL